MDGAWDGDCDASGREEMREKRGMRVNLSQSICIHTSLQADLLKNTLLRVLLLLRPSADRSQAPATV